MTEPTIQVHPKGGMCLSCEHRKRDCSHLDFASMPRVGIDKLYGVAIVACTEYVKKESHDA
jgi:hypothetical protein